MPLKIVVLEDNQERRTAMQDCLADRLHTFEPLFFDSPQPMLAYLRSKLEEAICISLDHDMELVQDSDGRMFDPGTGREVAEFLATQSPQCPVIVHSTNSAAAEAMKLLLQDAGWSVSRVCPFGNLEWVSTEWIRTVRRAIVDFAAHPVQ